MKRILLTIVLAAAACARNQPPVMSNGPLVRSVISIDTVAGTATMPLFRGRVWDTPVWYIVTESSDPDDARRRGVTYAPRLRALANTTAAQHGQVENGELAFSAGVDFAPERVLRAALDSGFPATQVRAGSVARQGYSSFVQLRGGVIINAPIIADASGALDRVIALDALKHEVKLRMSRGYHDDHHAWYISTEASDEMVAAFERATYMPALATAPLVGVSDFTSARSGIIAIVNGVRERGSEDRQGLQSAMLNDLSPLNILQHAPDFSLADTSYSPLWDLHLVRWTNAAIGANQREKIFSWADGVRFARRGLIVNASMATALAMPGSLTAAGIAINCPLLITFGREAP